MNRLSITDMMAPNAQVRFRSLKRKRATCEECRRRTMVSTRLKICQTCFHGEKLHYKGDYQ
jgi:hypothetical protein